MPVSYRIFGACPFVLSTALGNITDAELLAHQRELIGDEEKPIAQLQDTFWALLNSREFLFNH